MKKTKKGKKQKGFDKKDVSEIFDRVITSLLVSMVTQALKKGVPLKFGGQPVKEANFLTPIVPPYDSKKKTRNPAYDRTRKGKTRVSD